MNLSKFLDIVENKSKKSKYFLPINFGCRANSAELNQLSQILVDQDYIPTKIKSSNTPNIIIVNTCAITQKGEYESLSKIRSLKKKYENSIILVTGCASLNKIDKDKNIHIFNNKEKEAILETNHKIYTKEIGDKFTNDKKYLLKIQSGCKQFCSYCTVPYQRNYDFSLSPSKVITTVNKAIKDGYEELIITGVNLNEYKYILSNLVEKILEETSIKKVSFGSVPINCVDEKFISLYSKQKYTKRLSKNLHIPIQSGSNKILKLMNRPYNRQDIIRVFSKLKKSCPNIIFGTDVIVGFPGETKINFKETVSLCKKISFNKIHTFRYSRRPNTLADYLYKKYPKIASLEVKERSKIIRSIDQTTLPSHQRLQS